MGGPGGGEMAGAGEYKAPPIAPTFDLGRMIFDGLREKLVDLLDDACHRGRGRLDSGADSDPEWFIEDMQDLTDRLDRILTGKE